MKRQFLDSLKLKWWWLQYSNWIMNWRSITFDPITQSYKQHLFVCQIRHDYVIMQWYVCFSTIDIVNVWNQMSRDAVLLIKVLHFHSPCHFHPFTLYLTPSMAHDVWHLRQGLLALNFHNMPFFRDSLEININYIKFSKNSQYHWGYWYE